VKSSYSVWDRSAALSALLPVLVAAVVALVAFALAGRLYAAAVAVPVLALVAAGRARSAGRLLAVSGSGIVLRGRQAPWRHVESVGVGPETVEIVLGADAPLPAWMGSRISDPSDPEDRVRLREPVPGLDPSRLDAAVRAVPGAGHVRVVRR
jgi:hypothetical protein